MITIAVTNQKGGVGKTTTAVNLAHELGAHHNTVLVDLDPQGNATMHAGQLEADGGELLAGIVAGELAAHATPHQFDLVAAGAQLVALEASLEAAGIRLKSMALRRALGSLPHELAVLDCPPTLGLLTFSALVAATHVVVPVQTEGASLDGLASLSGTLEEARQVNPALQLLAILPTLHDGRTRLHADALAELEGAFAGRVLDPVYRDVKLAEAYAQGVPVRTHAPSSRGARAYQACATRIEELIYG